MNELTATLEPLKLVLLVAAGIGGGFINVVAGGGSLLTIPVLLFLGLPAPLVNTTNRIAIVLQNCMGSLQFYRARQILIREWALLAPFVFAGSIAGSFIAVEIPHQLFDLILGGVLILLVVSLFIKPTVWTKERSPTLPMALQAPIFFLVGAYAGFLQVGVGLLFIPTIALLRGHALVRTNALKVGLILVASSVSLLIFWLFSEVLWLYGIILAIGSMTGAWIGVRFTVKRGAGAIRWVLVAVALYTALNLFGIIGPR